MLVTKAVFVSPGQTITISSGKIPETSSPSVVTPFEWNRPITGSVVRRAPIDFLDDYDGLYLDRDQSIMDNFTTTGLLFPCSSLESINPFDIHV